MEEKANERKLVDRLYIPKDLALAFRYYKDDERMRVENPDVKKLITEESLMIAALENAAAKVGHYPPRVEASKKAEPPL